MPIKILMPALSPTMEEGTLAKWLVREGDQVTPGTVIAEIETDKATMEFEAVDEGTVGKLVIPEGTERIKVNDLIAVLLEEGEGADATGEASAPDPAKPAAGSVEATDSPPLDRKSGRARIAASPLARRLAASRGIDLTTIKGSGPAGRIVKLDVDTTADNSAEPRPSVPASGQDAPAPNADAIKGLYSDREYEEIKLDAMRRTIAARLTDAKRTIPHFYLRREIRLDPLLLLRAQLNQALESRAVKLSVNDFIIKAAAIALQQVPACNVVWAGDRMLRLSASDIAVAVAIEGGLITPVLRDAEKKPISVLSLEMKELASRARNRRLLPHEYQGGSFAVSNLGMMGVDSFDAIINPPHASILAVGAGVRKPVVSAAGDIEIATMMSASLSIDHRAIDGAQGAEFLEALRSNIENPFAMLA